jgi:hypothetical protein
MLALFLLIAFPAEAQLNDTAQITCYNLTSSTGTVSSSTPVPETSGFEGQDCTSGRTAADALGKLPKVGASTIRGRDYTKIGNDGSELPSSATLGSGATDWGCTRDNLTGLIWEIKTDDNGLRDKDHQYRWYDDNPLRNGGNAGTLGFPTDCNNTLPGGLCNTNDYRAAVNGFSGTGRLCGHTDWRLPSRAELLSIFTFNFTLPGPYVDLTWFPDVVQRPYWTGDNYALDVSRAWNVEFSASGNNHSLKSNPGRIRLVRAGH